MPSFPFDSLTSLNTTHENWVVDFFVELTLWNFWGYLSKTRVLNQEQSRGSSRFAVSARFKRFLASVQTLFYCSSTVFTCSVLQLVNGCWRGEFLKQGIWNPWHFVHIDIIKTKWPPLSVREFSIFSALHTHLLGQRETKKKEPKQLTLLLETTKKENHDSQGCHKSSCRRFVIFASSNPPRNLKAQPFL